MRIIDKPKKSQQIEKGSATEYYSLENGIGLKTFRYHESKCKTIPGLIGSKNFVYAIEEWSNLLMAEKSGITPKPIALVGVKIGYKTGKLIPGILMEHIEGEDLRSYPHIRFDAVNIIRATMQKRLFDSCKCQHSDIWEGNIIRVSKNNFKLVDLENLHQVKELDPHYSEVLKKATHDKN